MTEARLKASFDFLAAAKLIDPAKVDLASAFPTTFVKDLKVMP
jgi:NitT/TauT family transport system substrate-binding protein